MLKNQLLIFQKRSRLKSFFNCKENEEFAEQSKI